MKMLIKAGADVNVGAFHNTGTPLMLATDLEYDDIVKILREAGARR